MGPHDDSVFLALFGIILGALFWMLEWNGIVAVSWYWSILAYLLLLAVLEWSYLIWQQTRTWSARKRYSINLAMIVPFVTLCSLAVETQYNRQNDHSPMRIPATKADVDQLSDMLSLINSHIYADQGSHTPLPGFSAHITLRVRQLPKGNGKGYILDIGNQNKGRFSVYTTKDTAVFSIIDLGGKVFALPIPIGFDGLPYQAICYAEFEYGAADNHSEMDIVVDGRIVASHSEPYKLDIGPLFARRGTPTGSMVLGADLRKQHAGVFDAFGLATFDKTLSLSESRKLASLALQPEHVTHRCFLRFNGHQWASNDLATNPTDSDLHFSDLAIRGCSD